MPTRFHSELGLYDARGHRKYLTPQERTAFLAAAEETPREVRTLCGGLAYTGCRLSEALLLTADRVDLRADLVIFESLKKRRSGIYRAVPVPHVFRACRKTPSRMAGSILASLSSVSFDPFSSSF